MSTSPNVTQLLVAWSAGDTTALHELTPVIQHELHRLATRQMAGERPGHILQPTALVNEAYMRLVNWKEVQWQNRAHFFGTAAQIMRRVLVDMARTRDREKRGGRQVHVSLSEAENQPAVQRTDLMALDEAMKALELIDARKSQVVELRYFGGLTFDETAEAMGISTATAWRDWQIARAWLHDMLRAT